jgi:pyruvate/2-oxoglutarate dehydrogenase complex dihydrolipoamide acyltransferase (E2) component
MTDVVVPKWGLTIEEVVISEWLCQQGDRVDAEQPIVRVETDKVDSEIVSPVAGILEETRYGEGDQVEPGWVIATIDPS